MSNVDQITNGQFQPRLAPITSSPAQRVNGTGSELGARSEAVDRVEVSSEARFLDALRENPIRTDLVERVRAEIEAGTYVTDQRLDAAADAIAGDLFS